MPASVDSAIKIAFLTAASYVVAYAFESSYLGYFGLPIEFVEVDLRSVLFFGFALWSTNFILYPIFVISAIPTSVKFFSPRHVVLRYIGYPCALLVAWAVLWSFDVGSAAYIFIFSAIAIFAAGDLVWPLYEHRGKVLSHAAKIYATWHTNPTADSGHRIGSEGPSYGTAAVLALMVTFAAIVLGQATGKTKRDFLVANDCVALRVTGDRVLCAIWAGQLTGEYEFRSVEGVRLTMERIGPLQRYTHHELRPAPAESKASATDRPDSRIAPLTN